MGGDEESSGVTIVEERIENMVAHTGGTPTLRMARFLKPSAMSRMGEVVQVPLVSPLRKPKACKIKECLSHINFSGWNSPQRIWAQWVDRMSPMYGHVWKKSGIYESIVSSTYKFTKEKELILGLADCWCSDTNTFAFSWGEATLTLEDMFVIGGFSVLGEPVTSPLTDELVQIEEKMIKERKECNRTKAHKAHHYQWIKRFMGSNDELEHIAFLSLWLSRFVLPSKPELTVNDQVFPIAILLSESTQIALALAVLATLYRDLRLLKVKIDSSTSTEGYMNNELPLSIWAPFQFMQLWAWERFLSLQPTPNSLNPSEPRAARWHLLKSGTKFDSVRSSISTPDNFLWRPYSSILNNWQRPLFYKDEAEWIIVSADMNTELLSFAHFIVPCELVGLDCIEQYLPHRVGMQFGMDQDIPGSFSRADSIWEVAWKTYDKHIGNTTLYVPPRLFEADVTVRYFDWWNQYISAQHGDTRKLFIDPRRSSYISPNTDSPEGSTYPLGISCQPDDSPSLSDDDKMTLSDWYKHQTGLLATKRGHADSDAYVSTAPVQSSSSITEGNINIIKRMITGNNSNLCSELKRNIVNAEKSETCHPEIMSDIDGLNLAGDLETRIDRLATVVDRLKVLFGSRKKKTSSKSTSHAQDED